MIKKKGIREEQNELVWFGGGRNFQRAFGFGSFCFLNFIGLAGFRL